MQRVAGKDIEARTTLCICDGASRTDLHPEESLPCRLLRALIAMRFRF